MAGIATDLARQPDAFSGSVTPLDIADKLLEREARHHEISEFVFSISSVELNHPVIAPVRRSALAMLEESLHAAEPRRLARAVRSLALVLSTFDPIAGRRTTENERAWQDAERLEVLDCIERRIRKDDAAVPLLREMKNSLRQLQPKHHSDVFNRRLREVEAAIPDSEELCSYDSFCTGDFDWRFDVDDLTERDRLARTQRQIAVERFSAAHPQAGDQIRVLEGMAQNSEQYGVRINDSADLFIGLLCRNDDFKAEFIRYVLNEPHPRLAFQIRTLLPHLRSTDPTYYEEIGLACAHHSLFEVSWGAAHGVCLGRPLEHPNAQDATIISELAMHPNGDVRRLAIFGAGRLGRVESFQEKATQIISSVDVAAEYTLANAVCEAFGGLGMSTAALTRDQIQWILNSFIPIHRFDEPEHDAFFSHVAMLAPDILFDFFFERLKRYGNTPGETERGYAHWGNTPPDFYFREAPIPEGAADQLRRVRDFIIANSVPRSWTAELFWVFGDAAGATGTLLEEWLNSGDAERATLASYLATARNRSEPDREGGWTDATKLASQRPGRTPR